ncbi:hypothetical protein ACFOTA_15010 [Chitinophaga sp. GCM10012297]|uniref:DNA-binding protein n=1 Tax=Chitinophaga chungangae TaxID=2821488 RepID=A0ABS3YFU6_9BACT|nr:hypothetical protein [Chitinophaga chungangae]MBO9153529.1 hypothetical protein [Chitinophaga chungangae]
MKKDKKKYDAVQEVREIGDRYSEYHRNNPEEFRKALKAARKKLAPTTKAKKPN